MVKLSSLLDARCVVEGKQHDSKMRLLLNKLFCAKCIVFFWIWMIVWCY